MTKDQVPRKPTILIILDGFGWRNSPQDNAVIEASTPNLDHYFQNSPFTTLQASGAAVGLPDGQMGNSEVGHMTMGCGKILRQDLVRINQSIETGSFYRNPTLLDAAKEAKRQDRPLHLLGLVSDGGVHSHINHLKAILTFCGEQKIKPMVHMITDGRDTAPKSAMIFLEQLTPYLKQSRGEIASVSGRFYGMDRDKRWDRVEKAWNTICFGKGEQAESAQQAISNAYEKGITDEFIPPTYITGAETIEKNDPVVFFNFRNDRARQLTYTLAGKDFKPFDRADHSVSLYCLTEYDPLLSLPIAFPPEFPDTSLAEIVSENNLRQLHCAETEKYAHVTFFFNGGREAPYPGEERQMIPSPNVTTYDLAPEMAAKELTDEVLQAVESEQFGFIVVNYANGDMVGHTAIRESILTAVETLDREVDRLIKIASEHGYSILLTADHGNCEEMVSASHEPQTQHTSNPVPCIIIDDRVTELNDNLGLSHIAPTILQLMGLEANLKMEKKSIIANHF